MIELYHSGRLYKIYVCTNTGSKRKGYLDMINENWNRAAKVDQKTVKLSNIRWSTLKNTSSYGTVAGLKNEQQQLYYIRDLGTTNIRVPFYFYDDNVIILFPFKKKSKKDQNKLFKQAESLQTEINKWIDKNGFPNS